MLKLFKFLKDFLFIPIPENYKMEFKTETNLINLSRVKTTAITFIVLEVIIVIATLLYKKDAFLEQIGFYYLVMYVSLIIAMIVFLLVFSRLRKNVSKNGRKILAWGITYSVFIVLWSAGISLMDQLTSGQIIVYVFAIIAIAVVPFFEPVILLVIYLAVQSLFIGFLPLFHQTGMLFGNIFNSTLLIILSLIISRMRFKSRVQDFNNRMTIQEKNDELVKVNRELEIISRTDSLTGVLNRLVFDKRMDAEWNRCKRHAIPLSLVMVDIDYFKAFNDNYGHQAGDESIKQVAAILAKCAKRSADTVTRYGGDEFAIILPHMYKKDALDLARVMRDRVFDLKIPHAYSSCSEYLTISLGLHTMIPYDEISINEFIRTADIALYEAKKDRNTVVAE